jgi:hemin uptake protein HemP
VVGPPLTRQAQPQPASTGLPPSPVRAHPVLDSRELLRGARLVEISHNGEIYRLQATRLGKLILTK